jgi:hypothetical protein
VRRRLAPLACSAAALALALAGCVHEREKVVGIVPEGALAPPSARDRADRESSWSERAFGRRRGRGAEAATADGGAPRWGRETVAAPRAETASFRAPTDAGSTPAFATAAVEAPGRSTPEPAVARTAAPAAHRAIAATTSLEDVAREKFLVATTTIAAQRATLYVPAAYAAEISLTGATVSDDAPGRRTATGTGVVTLRRLTVKAAQVTVVVRDGNPDVQLTARGDVSLHSDQPASVLDETGLRSLFLKNDGYTPFR